MTLASCLPWKTRGRGAQMKQCRRNHTDMRKHALVLSPIAHQGHTCECVWWKVLLKPDSRYVACASPCTLPSPISSHIDLLSVLVHENGNVMASCATSTNDTQLGWRMARHRAQSRAK